MSYREIADRLMDEIRAGRMKPEYELPGHWDGLSDFRTGKETVHPIFGWTSDREGIFVVTNNAASTCPSGPCGMVTRVTIVAVDRWVRVNPDAPPATEVVE